MADVYARFQRQRGNEVTRFSEHQVFARWFPEQSDRFSQEELPLRRRLLSRTLGADSIKMGARLPARSACLFMI